MKKLALSETHPELAAEADGWDPSLVSQGSNSRKAWKCNEGHRYEAITANRTRGTGCPYCANKKVLPGFNDLATLNPSLAFEAHGWNPSSVRPGSDKKVDWMCGSGHLFSASIGSRALRGTGCPYCAGTKVLFGFNDLATTDPELAIEAYEWDSNSLSRGSNRSVKWKCPSGHIYRQSVSARVRGYGCSICSSHQIVPGINDLATVYPDVAAEADGWSPVGIAPATSTKKPWRCPKEHLYVASISSRTRLKTGCPYCSGHLAVIGVSDLATLYPAVAREADSWDPVGIAQATDAKKPWVCPEGHRYFASISSRTRQKTGCPYCSGRLAIVGKSDLATVNPTLAKQARGWDPAQVTSRSSKKTLWVCQKNHEWYETVANRANGSGCPVCSNQQVLAGFNDLATLFPQIASEATGWDPKSVIPGSGKKLTWECPLGHLYTATPTSRTGSKKSGCPYCASVSVLSGFNDLATRYPEIAAEVVGVDASLIAPNSNKKIKWLCTEGHNWWTTPNNRVKGSGCPTCAKTGYDPNAEGYLYFLEQEVWGLLQIGITNEPEVRLKAHSRSGWNPIEVRGPLNGDIAQYWETEILRSLRRREVHLGPIEVAGKFDGYTEAWIQGDFPAKSLAELMGLVHADDEKN